MPQMFFHMTQIAVVTPECADIAKWQEWAHSDSDITPTHQAPDYSVIAPSVRRRLSVMGRCALTAYASLTPEKTEPTIWASSWGDISRTFKLTQSLAESSEMSPAEFALSVHNAIGAQAAIWLQNHTATTAIAAGELTASSAFIEAYLKLQHCPSVILVRYEDVLPALWNHNNESDASPLTCAWAIRLSTKKSNSSFTLKPCNPFGSSLNHNILSEIRFLLGGISSYEENDGQRGWHWEWT